MDPAWTASRACTLEGRKHVWVSMGPHGLLWLSATVPADPSHAQRAADLCATLPFFLAAQHPGVAFDYAVIPPVSGVVVRKVTGAGDTLVGCTLWALHCRHTVADALLYGSAGAVLALEGDPRGGAVPGGLDGPDSLVRTRETRLPRLPPHEYA